MFFQREENETPLTEAVIRSDLGKVRELKGLEDYRRAENFLGFDSVQLAHYLGRKESIALLDPHPSRTFLIRLKNENTFRKVPEIELNKIFSIEYAYQLKFPDYRLFKRLLKKTAHASRDEAENTLWMKYRKKISEGYVAPVSIRWIDDKIGYGLFAERDFPAGEYIGEYVGEVGYLYFYSSKSPYALSYPLIQGRLGKYVVDAQFYGNETRFINHRYEPNLILKTALENGLKHSILFASKDIPQGSELFWNYGEDYWSKRQPPIE